MAPGATCPHHLSVLPAGHPELPPHGSEWATQSLAGAPFIPEEGVLRLCIHDHAIEIEQHGQVWLVFHTYIYYRINRIMPFTTPDCRQKRSEGPRNTRL